VSITYKMSLSDELAELVEQRRGVLSVQEFTLLALLDRCNGSAVEQELRQHIQQLMQLLGRVTAPPRERQASEALDEPGMASSGPGGDDEGDERLGWG
jgi:hypothetical protein